MFSQQASRGPTAHYTPAASSNTATRESHCNKLLFINSLFLLIFNNLYILHRKVQILAFQQVLIYTLANKQELLKENKRAKSRRIGTHLLSSIFLNYRLGRGVIFS